MRTTKEDMITSNLEKYDRRVEMYEEGCTEVMYDMVFRDFPKKKRKNI